MSNGETVQRFEAAFAEYVGARYAIALCNGTATLHTALVALGVKPGDRVAVPPLTMASTTIAVLHAGAVPVFMDVDPRTWLMDHTGGGLTMGVSLYGLNYRPLTPKTRRPSYLRMWDIDDAAQTLRRGVAESDFLEPYSQKFTSYSFQASKILALGEGGMLVTNDEDLARRAREFSSLGYHMDPDQPRIDPATLKHPTYARHHSLGWNYRMSSVVAWRGMRDYFDTWTHPGGGNYWDHLKRMRREAAGHYANAIYGCDWITPQHVPEGWTHDYWCYAVALEDASLWEPFTEAIVRHGGEMPYGAWRLTYHEPAFRHLSKYGEQLVVECPIAEDLQPRLVQFQTNQVASAQRNADAVAKAIREIDG